MEAGDVKELLNLCGIEIIDQLNKSSSNIFFAHLDFESVLLLH